MDADEPEVVLIYTQKSKYPTFLFRLGSVPLALASLYQLGRNKFAVLHAHHSNVEISLKEARFLVLGVHGVDGGIMSDDGEWIGPSKLINPHLKHVYFGSCSFGKRRKDWQKMFPNGKVIGHDELTSPTEGAKYLLFNSWRDLLALEVI